MLNKELSGSPPAPTRAAHLQPLIAFCSGVITLLPAETMDMHLYLYKPWPAILSGQENRNINSQENQVLF